MELEIVQQIELELRKGIEEHTKQIKLFEEKSKDIERVTLKNKILKEIDCGSLDLRTFGLKDCQLKILFLKNEKEKLELSLVKLKNKSTV